MSWSEKIDHFFFVVESFKCKIVAFIFPYLICNSTNDPGRQCLH